MDPNDIEAADQAYREALATGDRARMAAAERALDELDVHRPPVPLVAAALWYAERGLRVFALQPGRKIPFARTAGFHDATTDPDVIRCWWAETPEANIGIATGCLVDVVDIDGAAGQLSRARNAALFDALTVVGTVSTPRPGGMHLFVPAAGVGNKANLLDHVDYRGNGGYVVAAPSVITDGPNPGRYEWIRPLDVAAITEEAA